MNSHRPFSSNLFKGKSLQKKLKLMKVLNNSEMPQINNTYSRTRPPTSLHLYKEKSNIFAKSNENFDILNLMIKSNPNQYNQKKINKKIVVLNPLYIRGSEENLKRPNYNENTEKVFYKYNLLYGNNSNNLIKTYSPKMRPMSSSVKEFNKKMISDNNGKNIYVFNDDESMKLIKARCKDIGINLRENMIYKFKSFINSKCKNRCVDLPECYLGEYSIKFISKFIYKADRISRLNLTKNNLGDVGIEILMKAVKNSMSLISLNVSSNNITYKGGQIIFADLAEQQSVIDLNISTVEGSNRNHLNYLGLRDIEHFFNKNKYIETLNICGNSIKDEGFISLCKGLKDNKNLQILNISNNEIHSQGLTQGLNLISTCKIYSLNLSQNKLLDAGIKILSNSLQFFPNLHKLNLSNCGFEFNGFEYLMTSLSTFKTLSSLNVSGNILKHKNFDRVRPYLESNSIKNLNVAKCSLGNDSAYILGDCLSSNESIKKLNISGNKISDVGFQSFVNIFSHNSNIESLDCSINLITDLSARNFVKNIRYNHILKKINFFDNQLTNVIGNLFLEILETNKTLRSINLLLNKVQLKTMEEINKILKANSQKEKAKYVPELHKAIKNLQFNPQSFKFYEKNIKYKKLMQSTLYKRVKKEDKHLNKLINKENRKIDLKINQKINIESEVVKVQNEIKQIMQNLSTMQDQVFEQEKDLEKKIEIEKKNFKKIKDGNDLLKIEFNATKKSFDDIINETIEKQKRAEDKLSIAQLALNSKMKEINKKRDMLAKLYDPDLLVPINTNKNNNNNQFEMIKERLKKSGNFAKKTTFNNILSEQFNTANSTSINDNMVTTTSNKNMKDSLKKMILKKSISNVK